MTTKQATTEAVERAERVAAFFQRPFCGIPRIFGILNVTPDSFSDGGLYLAAQDAVRHAEDMLDEGAAAIDIGAESTRPGALEVPAETETAMLLPVIEELKKRRPGCLISVDTRKADVACAVIDAGADIINDVSGLTFDPAMAEVIASKGAGLILMHMRETPETMQQQKNLVYQDLLEELNDYFAERIRFSNRAGICRERIALDPGIGFAKSTEQNLELIQHAERFRGHGCPLFYGISRKSFLGTLCARETASERDFATAGALAFLTEKHTDFVRVHAVAAARDAMTAYSACSIGIQAKG